MTRSTVTPWEDRLAVAQSEIESNPGKRTLLEYSRLKAKAIAEEIAEWRALAAQGTAEGVLRDGVELEPVAWCVFAEDKGVMVAQHPAYAVKLHAERCAAMFGQTATEVRPLYAAPAIAAPTEVERDALLKAVKAILAIALDEARGRVHICDIENDDIKAKTMSEEMQALYAAITATKE